MKRYSFATFQVHDSNREAFEACQALAELRAMAPQPVILVGDNGCGKTHLLYAVVRHIRAHSARTGLAFVTARDFPEAVRRLIADPSPVDDADSAILLVDQLEQFNGHTEDLEAVVRLFLEDGHAVLIACSVHPTRLQELTPGLRAILDKGRIIPMKLDLLQQRRKGPEFRSITEDLLKRQQEEQRRLRQQLKEAEERVATALGAVREAAELRRELEMTRSETQNLHGQIEAERQVNEAMNRTVEEVRGEVRTLQGKLDEAEAKIAQVGSIQDEAARLREQLHRAETQRDEAERRAPGSPRPDGETGPTDEPQALRLQLDTVRAEKEELERQAEHMRERVQSLLGQVESSRAKSAEMEAQQRGQIRDLEAAVRRMGDEAALSRVKR